MPTLKIFGLILCLVTILGCRTNALIKSSVSDSSTYSEIPDLPEWHEPKLVFISEAVLEKRPFRVASNVLYDLSWAIKSGSDANKAIPTTGQRPSYAELQAIWERCLEAGKDFDVHGRISQSTQDGLLVLVGGPSQKKLIYLENHPDHDLLVDGESVNVWAFPSGVYRFTTITGASATVRRYDYGLPYDPRVDQPKQLVRLTPKGLIVIELGVPPALPSAADAVVK